MNVLVFERCPNYTMTVMQKFIQRPNCFSMLMENAVFQQRRFCAWPGFPHSLYDSLNNSSAPKQLTRCRRFSHQVKLIPASDIHGRVFPSGAMYMYSLACPHMQNVSGSHSGL